MRILYLGESEEIYTILDEIASLSQSEVIKIGSVKEVIDILTTDRNFHGIIAHPKVNNIPSLQVWAFMKRDESLKDIPFIIIAENITKDDIDYYKAMGVAEVFEIPFNPLEVFLVITNKLKDIKGEEAVKQILKEPEKHKSVLSKIFEFVKKFLGTKQVE
ncbi:histidine kinase [Sulfurihydrogenibium sp.]|jgi:DNA-binding NtrC family response regulator|uniref:histidine kinase n=1 Tax=Sulfurihydrogenibium sp. TaxID=2053621 RepID=UPI002634F5FE|nr:histidine kinase [Sulfurihydrogenibium sp.]